MFQTLLKAVRDEVSGGRALESVRVLSRFHRVQASPGYDAAADWIAAQAEAHGLQVEVEHVPGDGHTRCLGHLMPEGWECTRAVATLVDGASRERLCDYGAEKLSLVLRSAPARGRFPLIVVEDGSRSSDYESVDVRGKVVLCRGAAQRVHELAVIERGAAGILHHGRRLLPPVRDRFDDPDSLAYTSFWWGETDSRGWGFVISPRMGQRLSDRLSAGARLELEVDIESRAFATTIPLVSACLPGDAPGGSEVLVLAHLCHPQPSANDNASGAAAALEVGRALAALQSRGAWRATRRSVRVLWVPEITGTMAWLAQDPDRATRIAAAVNLDMVGQDQHKCGSTFLLEHPPCFAASFAEELLLRIRAESVDWVPSYSGPGHYSMTRMAEVPYSGGSDHYVLIDPATGVPCPMLIQWPDRYYHSSHDTPDKTNPDSLALAARCAATYAGFLVAAETPETEWLLDAVGRGARRRLLAAIDEPNRTRAVMREVTRGHRALFSMRRLGVTADAVARADAAFDEFERRETHTGDTRGANQESAGLDVIAPRRSLSVPLHFQRHLLPGWRGLAREVREKWLAAEAATPDALTICDLAWYACDGTRTLDEIEGLVWLETGRHEPELLKAFFARTDSLGLTSAAARAQEGASRFAEPDTATR